MGNVKNVAFNEFALTKFAFPKRCPCETWGKHCLELQIMDRFSPICCQMAGDHHMSKYNDIWKV